MCCNDKLHARAPALRSALLASCNTREQDCIFASLRRGLLYPKTAQFSCDCELAWQRDRMSHTLRH